MKIKHMIIFIFLCMIPILTHAETNVLYDTIKDDSSTILYTGEHQDSYNQEATDDVYRWTGAISLISTKNNVLFADHCWQIVRTTDTGGVKLLYNGEAENKQCLDTRGRHTSYGPNSTQTLSSNYWYGTSYEFDSTTNKYKIAGEIQQAQWSDATYNDLIGKYTCKSTSKTATCSTIYIIASYNSANSANVVEVKYGISYYAMGITNWAPTFDTLAYFGYMYNTIYTSQEKTMAASEQIFQSNLFKTTYWYGDDILYDNTTNSYSLVNPFQISSSSEYESLIGKYTLKQNNENDSSTSAYYIAAKDNSQMLLIEISSGHELNDYNDTYTYGNSYRANDDGTYTILNATTFNRLDYASHSSSMQEKYVCKNAVNNTCSMIWKVSNITWSSWLRYITPEKTYKYAGGFTYDENTGKYTLSNNSILHWDTSSMSNLSYHQYTCFNTSGECENLYYVHNGNFYSFYYITLKDGKGVSTAINEMLHSDDVNKNDSNVKLIVDEWYRQNLLDYTEYLEDVIFCNGRAISNYSSTGWDPNGGNIYKPSHLKLYQGTNLTCEKITDQFSVSNPKAKLKYPIGLITLNEAKMARISSPDYFFVFAYGEMQDNVGYIATFKTSDAAGTTGKSMNGSLTIRPSISLKKGTTYVSGDGSKESPYIIKASKNHSIFVKIKNETKDLVIAVEDFTKVKAYEQVNFTVTPIKGYRLKSIQIKDIDDNIIEYETTSNKDEYTFMMPDSDVTIEPTYERTSAVIDVEDNSNTKEIIIQVNDVKAVVYEDVVKITIVPEDGYELEKLVITDKENNLISYKKTNKENEYSFVMPDTDVLIRPYYKKKEEGIPQNPKTNNNVILICSTILIVLLFVLQYTKKRV